MLDIIERETKENSTHENYYNRINKRNMLKSRFSKYPFLAKLVNLVLGYLIEILEIGIFYIEQTKLRNNYFNWLQFCDFLNN